MDQQNLGIQSQNQPFYVPGGQTQTQVQTPNQGYQIPNHFANTMPNQFQPQVSNVQPVNQGSQLGQSAFNSQVLGQSTNMNQGRPQSPNQNQQQQQVYVPGAASSNDFYQQPIPQQQQSRQGFGYNPQTNQYYEIPDNYSGLRNNLEQLKQENQRFQQNFNDVQTPEDMVLLHQRLMDAEQRAHVYEK